MDEILTTYNILDRDMGIDIYEVCIIYRLYFKIMIVPLGLISFHIK